MASKLSSGNYSVNVTAMYFDENTIKISYQIWTEDGWTKITETRIFLSKSQARRLSYELNELSKGESNVDTESNDANS